MNSIYNFDTERLRENIEKVLDNICTAAKRANRDPLKITLVAVTKSIPEDVVFSLQDYGIKDVGENRVQELLRKISTFEKVDVKVHMIGTLQKNKVKKVVGRVALIHSVDSEELAGEISGRSVDRLVASDILLQINVSREPTKHGISPEEVKHVFERIVSLSGIRVRGLMTIAPLIPAEQCRPYFREMRKLFESIRELYGVSYFDTLSMGMSNDYEIAIEEGATMIRIGTALFEGVYT